MRKYFSELLRSVGLKTTTKSLRLQIFSLDTYGSLLNIPAEERHRTKALHYCQFPIRDLSFENCSFDRQLTIENQESPVNSAIPVSPSLPWNIAHALAFVMNQGYFAQASSFRPLTSSGTISLILHAAINQYWHRWMWRNGADPCPLHQGDRDSHRPRVVRHR